MLWSIDVEIFFVASRNPSSVSINMPFNKIIVGDDSNKRASSLIGAGWLFIGDCDHFFSYREMRLFGVADKSFSSTSRSSVRPNSTRDEGEETVSAEH